MSLRRPLWLLPLGVGALSGLAFLPALAAQFVNWDDYVTVLLNPHYRGLGWQNVKWMFTTTLQGVYTPLAWLTLAVNYLLGGMSPRGYHLGNLLLHSVNAGLLYLVARRLLAATFRVAGDDRAESTALAVGAAVAALAFGVHPLRVESVAWVTERRDVLCLTFYLMATIAYLRAAEQGVAGGRWRLGSLAAFALALLSKGITMTLPLTLLVLDVYPLRRGRLGWRLVTEKVPYFVLAVLAAGVAVIAVTQGSSWKGVEEYGLSARVAVAAYSVWFYPWKLVWPNELSPLYPMPSRVDPLAWRFLGPMCAAAATTTLLLLARRRCPGMLAAWVHSAVVVAPVSGLVHAGYALVADRYSYLSGLGFAVVAGAGVTWVAQARRHGRARGWMVAAVAATTVLALSGWGAATWRQTTKWHDSEALWRTAIDVDEDCAICHNNLGAALVRSGALAHDLEEAETHFRRAIALRPRYASAHHNLGVLLTAQKRYEEAESSLRTFRDLASGSADGPADLGRLYVHQRRYEEALPLLRTALQMNARLPVTRTDLGRALNALGEEGAARGHLGAAERFFREAVEVEPGMVEPIRNLGRVLIERGEVREAVSVLGRAVSLDPRDATARFWLARAYLLIGDRERADTEIEALRRMDPDLAGRARAGR